jgi:response regulator NasT
MLHENPLLCLYTITLVFPHAGKVYLLVEESVSLKSLDMSQINKQETSMTEGTRILLVDSDQSIRKHLRELLENLGYMVVGEAEDGLDAVHLVRHMRPDLVLAEVELPAMSGIELAQLLREEQLAPVVLTVAQGNSDLAREACQAGVHGFLVRPVQEGSLRPTVEVVRARWQEYCASHQELLQLREQLETRTIIERAKGFLMDTQGLKEAEAFRKIQRLAMNNRKTMKEVAQAIMLANQL